jgi:hypothetical protein
MDPPRRGERVAMKAGQMEMETRTYLDTLVLRDPYLYSFIDNLETNLLFISEWDTKGIDRGQQNVLN